MPVQDTDRALIAQEAARLMTESGFTDWAAAKHKASQRLGLSRSAVPSNAEVAEAVAEQLQLYAPEETRQRLLARRELAVNIMQTLKDFHPRAVGALVSGLMTEFSPVEIQLFADPPEKVDMVLADLGWEYDDAELRLRHPDGREVVVPVCRLDAPDGSTVELQAFGADSLRWAPVSPVNGKPMQRLDLAGLKALLAAPDEAA